MSLSRSVSLGVLVSIASAWAACMVFPGLWLLLESPRTMFLSFPTSAMFGILCIAAGNFVFMVLVADRVFPSVSRRQFTWTVEMFTLSIMLTTVIAIVLGVLLR